MKKKNNQSHPLKSEGGIKTRLDKAKATFKLTGDRRAATRAYCAGNKWLEENAKATGNW